MINLKQLIFDKGLNQSDLANILGISQSLVSKIIRGERGMPEYYIERLFTHFGRDVLNKYTTPDKPFAPISQETPELINEVNEELSEADSFPMLPEEVSIKPNTDIREFIAENSSELEHVNPSQMLSRADMAERILRTSMMPTFQPDDIVFVRFIQDKMKIVDGDIYYIDSKNRPTMIRQVKFTEDGKLRLIAQNPQYGDIIMCRDEINNIAIIVGLLRMNFSDQYSELENLRRKNDQAMERRNDQMDKILEQQSKLIDFITKQN